VDVLIHPLYIQYIYCIHIRIYSYVLLLFSVRISTHPINNTICPGKTAIFSSEARGSITLAVSEDAVWKRFVPHSGGYDSLAVRLKYINFVSINEERTTLAAALRIKNVTPDDEGWYVFEAGNVMSNRAYLNVIQAPGIV